LFELDEFQSWDDLHSDLRLQDLAVEASDYHLHGHKDQHKHQHNECHKDQQEVVEHDLHFFEDRGLRVCLHLFQDLLDALEEGEHIVEGLLVEEVVLHLGLGPVLLLQQQLVQLDLPLVHVPLVGLDDLLQP